MNALNCTLYKYFNFLISCFTRLHIQLSLLGQLNFSNWQIQYHLFLMGHSIRKSHTVYVVAYLHCNLEVTKVLAKIAKASGCEAITEWIKPCQNHLYWSARTTRDGNGEVIWAKFSSFLSHVVNAHENLDNPLFNKCRHTNG